MSNLPLVRTEFTRRLIVKRIDEITALMEQDAVSLKPDFQNLVAHCNELRGMYAALEFLRCAEEGFKNESGK